MNIVTIMNFIRGVEPRNPNLDLLEPVKRQMELNEKYGFDNTFLLQYDALINPAFSELFTKAPDSRREIGVWIEIVRPLTEKVGIKWRGRPGYDWDWYVDPGFLPAYTKEEKKLLIDELMEKFREIFGEYPKTAASWLLDAFSIKYMHDKYKIQAFGICREQLSVDAYTLWGGPYNQPYYPSVNNMLCPAGHKETQINAPVFRLLGIDPIRGYNENRYAKGIEYKGCATMEPVWSSGKSEKYMRWFFKTYFENENLGIAYTQIGQENSFGWESMKQGLEMQYALVDEYASAGKIQVMKMSEAGKLFSDTFDKTPEACIIADSDPVESADLRSVWYTCENYRANLFFDGGSMYFRDIQKFDDSYPERYADEPCRKWDAVYDNLPVADERVWSFEKDSHDAGLEFEGEYRFDKAVRTDKGLEVSAQDKNGKTVTVVFDEKGINITGGGRLLWKFGKFSSCKAQGDTVYFEHGGFSYSVKTKGTLEMSGDNLNLELSGKERGLIFQS